MRGGGSMRSTPPTTSSAATWNATCAGCKPGSIPPCRWDRAGFGARVEVVDADGRRERFRIVGEDEADTEHGLVSWVSAVARALEGARVGDRVRWRRADEDMEVELTRVDYDDEPGVRH